MSLEDKLLSEMKLSLKEGNKEKLSAIRMARAALKNKEISLRKKLSEGEVLGVLSTLAKKHKEAIEQYQKGGREDLVKKEEAELAVISEYLPQPLQAQELEKIVTDVIQETGAQGKADFGKVMGQVMSLVKGRADGRAVKEAVEKKLSG